MSRYKAVQLMMIKTLEEASLHYVAVHTLQLYALGVEGG